MNTDLHYGSDYTVLPMTSLESGESHEIAPDILCLTVKIVNVCFVGLPERDGWVLVDAGMPGSAELIISEAERRFGSNRKPVAIVLTHGHFDHVGAIIELSEKWNVPVYAHELEMPYLTGQKSYVAPDTSVEGGMVAKMSFMFPIEPIQLGARVKTLPNDGTIPAMPGWRWVHTPGHSPGHISLFREEDRSLIAGDAFVTVKQDSLYKVFTQELEMSGPPRYLTPDWDSSRESVRKLEALKPAVAVTGHGMPVSGEWLSEHLSMLSEQFDQIAIPDYGKYVQH
jgi:glyoxylase-like metal-dependent hydrolase (beta-lactamase superfamily II)